MTARRDGVPYPDSRQFLAPPRLPWDSVLTALMALVLLQVWRVHELFPTLAVHGLPILMTVLAVGLLALGRDPRRRIGSLDQPLVRVALGILLLTVLSIPGSLYPGYSVNFVLKDYARTVTLMLLVGASVRGLVDLRRVAWVQLAGVILFSAVIVSQAQMGADGRLRDVAYYDVNDLAMLIVCTLPLVLYLWRKPARLWSRVLLAAGTVFLMVTLGKTGSRGGFLGLGPGAFPVAEGTLAPEALEQRRYGRGFKWTAAHNSFIQIGAELGVGGLILFVALFAAAFRVLGRLRAVPLVEIAVLAQILTGSLVAFIVTASLLSQAYSAYLYTLLGMVLGLWKIASFTRPPAPAGSAPPAPGVASRAFR